MDAQAGLCLCCSQTPEDRFSRVEAYLILGYSCEDRIKLVPRDHNLSLFEKLCDAKRLSSGWIFLSYPHTHDRFLYTTRLHIVCLHIDDVRI